MPLQISQIINQRYRIVSLLGQGGFGAVYRAWDMNLKRPCAVKENLETSAQAQQQFEREATVLANLSHPNLVRVTDHFVKHGQGQYLVMDFVEGDDLESMVSQQGPLPLQQAIHWISQIADALTYLHTRKPPVIHRDVKPANIRVDDDNKAFLVDFGLVKLYRTQVMTAPAARGITPGFAPPEQYGQGGTDVRSDIYALGATLYMLLTGQVPQESVDRVVNDTLPLKLHANSNVPPGVSAVIERAMALDPGKRYPSATEFQKDIDAAILPPPPGSIIPPSPPIEGFPRHRRRPDPCSLEIPLSRDLVETAQGVFGTMRKSLVEQILRQVSDLDPIQGKVVVLTGDKGVGTTSIIKKVREELRSLSDDTRLIASIDLRLVDDVVDVFQKIIDTIRQEGAQHSTRQIVRAVNKGYQKALEEAGSVEIRKRRAFGANVNIGKLGELKFKDEFEKTAPLDSVSGYKNTRAAERRLRDVLRELITVMISRGVRIAFFIDKLQRKATMDLMMPVIKTRGITSVLIVEQDKYRKWKKESSVDREIYVPRLWHVAERFLRVLVGPKNKHSDIDTKLFPRLVSYLDFRSQGLPKRLVEVLEDEFYIPSQPIDSSPDEFFEDVENLEIPPRLMITETQSIDVFSLGDLHNCVCTLDQEVFEACGINFTGPYQRQDRMRSSLYHVLSWIVDKARDGNKIGFKTLVKQFELFGISETKVVTEQVASKVVNLMKAENMVVQTARGLDFRGIFGWSKEGIAQGRDMDRKLE